MGIFTRYVNVEDYVKRIEKLLQVNADQKEIKKYLKQIEDYVVYIIKNHKDMHPNEIAKLNQVIGMINESLRSYITPPGFENIKGGLNDVFNFTRVYLMRHTEKLKGGEDKFWTNMAIPGKGVRQARRFARYLTEEVMLCPKPINVIIQCSDVKRTWTYAEIIRRQLVRTAAHFGKHINIATANITNHPALNFRFSKECMAELDPEYKKSEFGAFAKWLQGGYKSCPVPTTVASELGAWIREGLQHDSTQAWTIVIGVSHSFIIDSYLYYKTKGQHSSIIATADYAKFVGSSWYYNGKWDIN